MDKLITRLLKPSHGLQRRTFLTTCRQLGTTSITTSSGTQALASVGTKPTGSKLKEGPTLEHFLSNSQSKPVAPGATKSVLESSQTQSIPYLTEDDISGNGRKVYFDVHGCQMNVNDTEIAWSILQERGYHRTTDILEADVVLIMTCSIREGAEQKIWKKLHYIKKLKSKRKSVRKGGIPMKIGILGCMAERLKTQIVEREKIVDVVCGPDAYRDLPRLLAVTTNKQAGVNVMLSLDETYADVMPVRLNEDSVTAYVSIMRGCDNMCAYCIVPFTRGRERSRPIDSIVDEVKMLSDQGIKEVTLLGQNVNSYRDTSESHYYGNPSPSTPTQLSPGFSTVYRSKSGGRRFGELLDRVSQVDPEMRVRFTSPHPKDFPDEVLELIQERANICNELHLPAQSGNNEVLKNMRRGYTIEAYMELVEKIRALLPGVALTSDFIAGFCGETEEAHQQTVDLMRKAKYHRVYCFPYSMRQKTHAYHRLTDDVPENVKSRRHMELAQVYRKEAELLNNTEVGREHLVLIEGTSKRSSDAWSGRNDCGTKVIIPNTQLQFGDELRYPRPGDYVAAEIVSFSSQVLHGVPVNGTTLQDYNKKTVNQRTVACQS